MGILISVASYYLLRAAINKGKPNYYLTMQILKEAVSVVFIVALFILGPYTPWDRIWLMVGGCLGITLPSFITTKRLVEFNDSLGREEEKNDG